MQTDIAPLLTAPSPSARQPGVASEHLPLERMFYWERLAPEQCCFVQPFDGGQLKTYNWAQAIDEVRRVAAWLKAKQWPAGSRIAILGKNSAGWILSDWAIWMAGHVSVPIYPTLVTANVRQILEHSESVACFVGKLDDLAMLDGIPDQATVLALPLAGATVVSRSAEVWDALLTQAAPLVGEPVRHGRELATIVYTSGTTGTSKGVMFNFEQLAQAVVDQMSQINLGTERRWLSYLPMAHVVERMGVEMALLGKGGKVYFAESLETFIDDLRRARPNLFISVPRLWLKFQQNVFEKIPEQRLNRLLGIPVVGYLVRKKILKALGLDAVVLSFSGSAAITPELLAWWDRLGLHIVEAYGMTELACVSHSCWFGGIAWGTVGKPVPNVDHRIDPVTEEIQILSPVATLGYYKAPDLTRELFTDDG